jgi:error-prone DNA polymerase
MWVSVELHTRSAFSFLRGASSPEALVARAAELGVGTLALLDHDGLYGAPRFFRAAREAGVRALVGATVAVRDGVLEGRLGLLVASRAGYQNLCALLTTAKLRVTKAQAVDGLAAVTLAELWAHKAGLIALLLAAEDPLAKLSRRSPGRHREASWAWARALRGVYGTGCLAVELGRHLVRAEERRTQRLVALAAALGVPAVATGDARYARGEDARLHDVLTCIRAHTTVEEAGRRLPPNDAWALVSPAALRARFGDLPGAVSAAEALASRCAFTLEDLGYAFPEYPVPAGETAFSYLHQLTHLGARERYRPLTREAAAQVARELDLIARLNLAGYFLIVWDLVRFCRASGILAQGRGSAANSAVCYSLGITAVDPVGMGLLFERFLSEERGEWPDIDLDLPSGPQRERVIQYVYQRYGPRGAAMTANVITYRARSAVREVGRALGFPEPVVGRLARALGHWSPADRETLEARCADVGLSPRDPRVGSWLSLVGALQDLPRHLGQHSGGMVLARGRLDHVVPLEPAAMEGRVVIQWDKDDCADLGILKVDLLGLGMMALLEEAVPLVHAADGVTVDLAHLPQDDPETYAALRRADTVGVFQVESRAQMATLPRLKPRCFYDLVIEVALIRPGPVVGKMVHPYLSRRAGREPVRYPHPDLEPILRRTLGVPLFQEQLMRVAMTASGFTGGEAEALRRAMGSKRSVEKMQALSSRLREGMTRNGYAPEAQEEVLRGILSFAQYGFPESHSASFALLAYASAYLKTHFPASYCVALLNHWPMGFYHPATVVKDTQRHGVRVLPLCAASSRWACTREGPAVRLGLRYVRGLRESAARALEAARDQAPFTSLDDLRRRAGLDARELEALAELGALRHVDRARPYARREALWQVRAMTAVPEGLFSYGDTAREDAPVPAMTLPERLTADYRASGMTVGPHPLALYRAALGARGVVPAAGLRALRDGSAVQVAGAVITRQRPETAKGFFFLTLEDETGLLNGIVAPRVYEAQRAVFVGSAVLLLRGVLQHQDGVVSVKVHTAEVLDGDPGDTQHGPLALPASHDFR